MATKFLLQDSRYKTTTLKKHLIQHLIISGSSSIADIAKELQLSIPTVTKFVSELMNDNYILDLGKQNTPGGRKPNIYGLNPNAGYFVGVDVEVKKVLLATIDFCGNVIDEGYVVRYNLEDTEEAFDRLCEIVQDYIHQLEIDTSKVLQVGINLGGRVNPKTGFSYSFFHFYDKPLTEKIEKRIGIPVNLENDSRAMMYGEFLAGVVKNEKNILFININWGLGAGIIIDGKPYYGKSGFSGEVGHVCALDNEIICNCGKKGCLETEASGYAIERMLHERKAQGCTSILWDMMEEHGEFLLSDFVEAVLREDVLAIEIVEHIGFVLGRWVAGLINLLNPEMVILGGPLSATQDYLRLPVQSAIRKYSLNLVNQDTQLVVSKLGIRGGLIGACMLSRSRLLGMI